MTFIDGTNVLARLGEHIGLERPLKPESLPKSAIRQIQALIRSTRIAHAKRIRDYWFCSYRGSEETRKNLETLLRDIGFEPVLFQRKQDREKGVDIALTKEMLVNAFHQNMEIAVLVAGDADYVELVKETKRYGCRVYGTFFESNGLAPELRVAFDEFFPFEPTIASREAKWKAAVERIKHELAGKTTRA